MRAEVRHARHGYLLAWHILLLCAAGRTPTEIATFLFCSRSSVYLMVNAYHAQRLEARCNTPPPKASWLLPSLRRSLGALLTKVPAVYGWCRTRWSCATLAAQLTLHRGIAVSASTMQRWLHALGWVGLQLCPRGALPNVGKFSLLTCQICEKNSLSAAPDCSGKAHRARNQSFVLPSCKRQR
jgi:transposase